jgi:hypothetical protein
MVGRSGRWHEGFSSIETTLAKTILSAVGNRQLFLAYRLTQEQASAVKSAKQMAAAMIATCRHIRLRLVS